jgi:hypothetical protein
MPMTSYPLICYHPGCGQLAQYKIAARWSDGLTSELKTYGLVCAKCLPDWFRRSKQRQQACRKTRGEVLDAPGIFLLERGERDARLQRLPELEQEIVGED